MHKFEIPPSVIDRIMRRRGRLHIIDRIDPRHTALVIIDMQNAYLAEGQPGFAKHGVDIILNINELSVAFRRAGSRVIWLRNTIVKSGDHIWPAYGELRTPEARERMATALAKGSEGHAISARMALKPEDLIIDKYRYSAFIRGSSDIEQHLVALGIDTLVIGGVLTNVCCESTARDAMMLNYRVAMAAEATAAHTDQEYNSSLASILFAFGDVMTGGEIMERLPKAAKP
jgi:ureidoacrylate peracid hydrolase